MPTVAPVAELLAARAGEEMALNDRHLNPQLGRIVRTSASTAAGSRARVRISSTPTASASSTCSAATAPSPR